MTSDETPPAGWPSCEPEQLQIMLLGTYHMDNPGLDEVNVDTDDVLSDERQAQLEDLTERLADWQPDQIAVERPYDNVDAVNSLYESYRTGEYAYDREESFPAPHPMRNDDKSECRSEVVQIGFRLADRLDHDRVVPIDEHPEAPDNNPFANRDIDSTRKTAVTLPNPEEWKHDVESRLVTSAIPEYLAWMNQESQLQFNHDLMFGRCVRATGENPGTPTFLAHWYDRNLRMVHHLWRAMERGDERMLLVVGTGHIRVLRHLLIETPMCCPVSPLPYLPHP